jgi:hypothetical protein
MQEQSATIFWGMPHKFTLTRIGRWTHGVIEVNKDNGFCSDSAMAPVTVDETLNAWVAQGSKWYDAHKVTPEDEESGQHFGVRTIEVKRKKRFWLLSLLLSLLLFLWLWQRKVKGCWVWTYDHRGDFPSDSLIFALNVTAKQVKAGYTTPRPRTYGKQES